MVQPSPRGHAAEFGANSAAATDVEKIAATKSAAGTWIPTADRTAFMALLPAAMMGTVAMLAPVRRDNHAARVQWSAAAPTTIARRAPVLRKPRRACTARSRSKRSRGRGKYDRERRARG